MPVPIPPAIIAIGRNYAEHAAEMGSVAAARPMVFYKNPACVIGASDPIVIPLACKEGGPQVDYEGELAVIIDRNCKDVPLQDALKVVRGYAVANDVSARWWQREGSGGQFSRGKSFDSFCPMSAIVPASSIANPQTLQITTRVNGEVRQDASTSGMTFSVAALISELSRGTTILAGTVILTGSPAGVGHARKPPVYLAAGDRVDIEISGVGKISNPVVEES